MRQERLCTATPLVVALCTFVPLTRRLPPALAPRTRSPAPRASEQARPHSPPAAAAGARAARAGPQREARQREAPQPLRARAEHGEAEPWARAPAPRPADSLRPTRVAVGPSPGEGRAPGPARSPDPAPSQPRRDGSGPRPRGPEGEFPGAREALGPPGGGAPTPNPTSAELCGRARAPGRPRASVSPTASCRG